MALEQIHVKDFCILGVQTKFILQNKSMARAIPPPPPPRLQTPCSHLYSTFWQIYFHGDFLSHEDVRIFCFGEQLVQKFQLRLCESCSFSSLFSWGSCQVKKKIIVHVNNEKQECFQASLAGLPPCIKALGYFLRCIKRVHRQYVIGSLRGERE